MTSDHKALGKEVLIHCKKLVRQGLFAEADDLLTSIVNDGRAELTEKLEWINIASIQGKHEIGLQRLRGTRDEHHGLDWRQVETDLFIRARMFSEAIDLLKQICRGSSGDSPEAIKLAYAETLRRIEEELNTGRQTTSCNHMTFCINLDEHVQKFSRCLTEAGLANLKLNRIAGVKGGHLPARLLPRFGEMVSSRFKGTLGCFLSHFSAWERFLDTKADYALILEDDFRPLIRFPETISALRLPPSFDICWLNEGMATSIAGDFGVAPVTEVVLKRSSTTWTGNGGYGYLVSRPGATKLLEQVSEDGFFGDVDWRMLAYSLDPDIIYKLPNLHFAKQAMAAHLKIVRARKSFLSYAGSIALFGIVYTGSSRTAQNTGKHVHEELTSAAHPGIRFRGG
jgi:GR25 family glycosyltransferase involved in LPS biosynthesis